MPDDALQRIAMSLAGPDGCCRMFDGDGRCCMTAEARGMLAVVLHEIDCHGLRGGHYTGVSDTFAKVNGIEFEPAPWPKVRGLPAPRLNRFRNRIADLEAALLLARRWGVSSRGYSGRVAVDLADWIDGGMQGSPPADPYPDGTPKPEYGK